MLLTVKDACELHPMALDYSMSEQVENLSDTIATTSATAREFFDKNYVTKVIGKCCETRSQSAGRSAGRPHPLQPDQERAAGVTVPPLLI